MHPWTYQIVAKSLFRLNCRSKIGMKNDTGQFASANLAVDVSDVRGFRFRLDDGGLPVIGARRRLLSASCALGNAQSKALLTWYFTEGPERPTPWSDLAPRVFARDNPILVIEFPFPVFAQPVGTKADPWSRKGVEADLHLGTFIQTGKWTNMPLKTK